MRVGEIGAVVALPVIMMLGCSTREGEPLPVTTTGVGGGGTGGAGAQAGTGGTGGTGGTRAQGGGGGSNLCVLDQSNVDECVLAP